MSNHKGQFWPSGDTTAKIKLQFSWVTLHPIPCLAFGSVLSGIDGGLLPCRPYNEFAVISCICCKNARKSNSGLCMLLYSFLGNRWSLPTPALLFFPKPQPSSYLWLFALSSPVVRPCTSHSLCPQLCHFNPDTCFHCDIREPRKSKPEGSRKKGTGQRLASESWSAGLMRCHAIFDPGTVFCVCVCASRISDPFTHSFFKCLSACACSFLNISFLKAPRGSSSSRSLSCCSFFLR